MESAILNCCFLSCQQLQNLVSGCLSIGETLQTRRVFRKFFMAEVAVTHASRQNQIVVGNLYVLPVRVAKYDALPIRLLL